MIRTASPDAHDPRSAAAVRELDSRDSIDVPVGQFTAVMGPSGSLATTPIHVLVETA